MKTLDEYFYDWQSYVFGYGYGTGEGHIIPALKEFMDTIPYEGSYDYKNLEESVGSVVAWLFISILCRNNIIEYGTSPRFAWLTNSGKELKKYLHAWSEFKEFDENYVCCYPEHCNCDVTKCSNPFIEK